jgi:hypothetical protein
VHQVSDCFLIKRAVIEFWRVFLSVRSFNNGLNHHEGAKDPLRA